MYALRARRLRNWWTWSDCRAGTAFGAELLLIVGGTQDRVISLNVFRVLLSIRPIKRVKAGSLNL